MADDTFLKADVESPDQDLGFEESIDLQKNATGRASLSAERLFRELKSWKREFEQLKIRHRQQDEKAESHQLESRELTTLRYVSWESFVTSLVIIYGLWATSHYDKTTSIKEYWAGAICLLLAALLSAFRPLFVKVYFKYVRSGEVPKKQ